MPENSRLQFLLCGGMTALMASTACLGQVRVIERQAAPEDTVIVTRPGGSRTVTMTRQAPPADKVESREIRIERKIVNGEETIDLWIDGKKVDVESMEDVHRILGEGDQRDVDVRFFDGPTLNSGGNRVVTVGPRRFHVEGAAPFDAVTGFNSENLRFGGLEGFAPPKSMLGVHLEPISNDLRAYLDLEEGAGVRIATVVADSPASEAGCEAGDIIIAAKIGSKTFDSVRIDELREAIGESDPETKIKLTVLRKGKKKEISAKLGEWSAAAFPMNFDAEVLDSPFEGQIDIDPDLFKGRNFELQLAPKLENHLLQIQPRLHELQLDGHRLLRESMPNHDQMMQLMEQQMQKMQEMLDQLREQQQQLRQQVEESSTPEA